MRKIPVGDTSLAVAEFGTGPVLMFVHGFPLSHRMWQAQWEAFAATNWVLVPDLRGFGESGVSSEAATMSRHADDLAAILDHCGITEPICICGLSMGGYVAFEFMRRHGDRVQALILCDTRSTADSDDGKLARRQLASAVLEKGAAVAAEAMLPRLFAADAADRYPRVIEEVRRIIAANSPRGIAAASLGMAEREDMSALLPKIDVPTLVIVGESDTITPPTEMEQLAGAITGAQFVRVPHAGHMAPMEAPEVVNAHIADFLSGLPQRL